MLDLTKEHLLNEEGIVRAEVLMRTNATEFAFDTLRRIRFRYGYDHTPSGDLDVIRTFTLREAVSLCIFPFSLQPFI